MGDLSKCLPITLQFEGGWSDNPKDPGGATMHGVTIATFRHYHPGATVAQLKAISTADLEAIYRDGYWAPIRGDDLPSGLDLALFDYAVNSGVGAAGNALKAVVNLTPVEAVKAVCARRLSLLRSLKTWATFGKGWSSRVNEVLALGIKWAAGDDAAAELTKAAAQETAKAKTKAAGAAGSLAGAGAVPAAAPSNHLAVVVIALALAAIGAWLFFSIRKHQDAADALAAAAKGV